MGVSYIGPGKMVLRPRIFSGIILLIRFVEPKRMPGYARISGSTLGGWFFLLLCVRLSIRFEAVSPGI